MMKITRSIGIALVCCAILASAQDAPGGDDDKTTTTSSTTEAPPTTKPTPTTTSTTEAPPTPPPTPPPTTPTTTSKPAPAPTPTPTPAPYPRNSGKWSVEESSTNVSCIVLKGAIEIVVLDKNNETITLDIPSTAVATGSCAEPENIVLTWDSAVPNKQNKLTLIFEMNNATKGSLAAADNSSGITKGKFALQNITATVHVMQNSTEQKIQKEISNVATFQTPLKHSYTCGQGLVKASTGDFTLKIQDVQLEAYRVTPPGHREFSTPAACPENDSSDLVPIAVGAALAGLVVIVFIAYLIGRRRSRSRGYQSV